MGDPADIDDLDAQIAALQALKANKLAKEEAARKIDEKKAKDILIGSTPTKNKTLRDAAKYSPPPKKPVFAPAPKIKPAKQVLPSIPPEAGPSRLSSSLAALRQKSEATNNPRVHDSAGNSSKRPRNGSEEQEVGSPSGKGKGRAIHRDEDDLTVKHDLRIGPKEHGLDPEGENEWLYHEPNSGIRISKRSMAHSAVQDYLYGRYYLTPAMLYSVIRLSRDGATYDLPVEGDWLTIAVVAERGEVKISGTKNTSKNDDDDDDEDEDDDGNTTSRPSKPMKKVPGDPKCGKVEPKYRKRPPRKYVNLKLCSLPPRSRGGGGSSASGDALLQLLLFEADSVAHGEDVNEDGEKVHVKRYSGGSGGAYERWCNLTVGSVIAILNPKILRPLRAGSQAPHPLTLPLALNPSSGEGIALIGQAKDIGRCAAQQKDGNRCRTWVDLRENAVCEYHIHAAVQRGKSGRAEFTASTSSFALSTRPTPGTQGRQAGYDPKKRTGLLPANGAAPAPRGQDNGGGGATYVVGGGIVNTSRTPGGFRHHGDEHLGEKLGRRRAEKTQKRDEEREAEEALKRLLGRDGAAQSTGGKYLAKLGVEVGNDKKGKKRKGGAGTIDDEEEDEEMGKRTFSAQQIKNIGFDPTLGVGQRRPEDRLKRAEAIELLRRPDKVAKLGKPAGFGYSSVKAPPKEAAPAPPPRTIPKPTEEEDMVDLD